MILPYTKIKWHGLLAVSMFTILMLTPQNGSTFAYVFAGDANGIDIVAHPIGYNGTGGNITITIGVDCATPNADDMLVSVQNVIILFNALNPTVGNLDFATITGAEVDFESTLLHEMGHSLGLAHCNAATESGLVGADRNYTKATMGTDAAFNLDDGIDNIRGSEDDVRGDDVNLNYFRTANNNPFTIAGTVDKNTYSREVADLPAGDLYSTNADRDVGGLLGVPNTECAMQQGAFFGEVQRTLGHDDVAGLLYARTGLDHCASTADDYTVTLQYAGKLDIAGGDAPADIMVAFDDDETGFAVSQSGGTFLTSDNVAITTNSIFFNTGFDWAFNTELLPVELVYFAAKEQKNGNALLSWATASEFNHDYFIIERSTNLKDWEGIARISSSGEDKLEPTYYSYEDKNFAELKGAVYYRLKQVDEDGSYTYTDIQVLIPTRKTLVAHKFGPNPFRGTQASLSLELTDEEEVSLELITMDGKVLFNRSLYLDEGVHDINLSEYADLKAGMYILAIRTSNSVNYTEIIKSN